LAYSPARLNPPRKKASSVLVSAAGAAPRQAVVGLEAEFTLLVNDQEQKPEKVFRSPSQLLHHHDGRIIPRTGKSCHLPSGGALYFDTGVVEVATALIELEEHGGCARAVRSLWEQIEFVRRQLDAWETQWGQNLRLRGFSAHYNFSLFAQDGPAGARRLGRLAYLLCYLLPVPVMLLAANRYSTAIGARPRPGRIEITADFTPDPALMNAALALMAGVIAETARWPDAELTADALAARGLPLLAGFSPSKHSSRKGWRAHADDFPRNPFMADVNRRDWRLLDGRLVSLRQIGCEMLAAFRKSIGRFADRATLTHLREVLEGKARSLLDFEEGPPAYQDVGRAIDWGRRKGRPLPRSAYEKAIQRVIAHEPLRIGRSRYAVERMPGWYEFEFRNVRTGALRKFNLDELARQVTSADGA
jgi:hypothetical protein